MPSSPIALTHIIIEAVIATRPKRIVDIGMGTGKYGFLIREQTDYISNGITRDSWQLKIDGVEGYAPSIGAHQKSSYDEIYISEARSFLSEYKGEKYDVPLAIDIIEHFEPDEGVEFEKTLLELRGFSLSRHRKVILSKPGTRMTWRDIKGGGQRKR